MGQLSPLQATAVTIRNLKDNLSKFCFDAQAQKSLEVHQSLGTMSEKIPIKVDYLLLHAYIPAVMHA